MRGRARRRIGSRAIVMVMCVEILRRVTSKRMGCIPGPRATLSQEPRATRRRVRKTQSQAVGVGLWLGD